MFVTMLPPHHFQRAIKPAQWFSLIPEQKRTDMDSYSSFVILVFGIFPEKFLAWNSL
jgi:hypothetical protein